MTLARNLGLTALALGAAAPFVGSPYRASADTAVLTQAIAKGDDHVSALQLASWIRARRPGLRVVDVRTPAAFAEFAIPGAENIPLERLLQTRFAPGQTVVLYSEEGAHAGQAWVLLQLAGVKNSYFIAGGLADWRDEVMAPTLPSDASPAAAKAFEAVAALSAYFGGQPRIGAPGSAATTVSVPAVSASADLAAIRRRGC
jgi:rhodanese-related sulfurtransferase